MASGDVRARRLMTGVLASLMTAAAVGVAAGPALATSDVQVTLATATPEQNIPLQIGYSGSTDASSSGSSHVYSVARPGGAQPCASTYTLDLNGAGGADYIITTDSHAPGAFSFNGSYEPSEPGAYLICTWIQDGNGNTVAGPVSTPFTARGPQVSQFTVGLPLAPVHDRPFQIVYTTQTDQSLNLDSVIKPAGGAPCAAAYQLENQQDDGIATILISNDSVFGGPSTTPGSDTEKSGSYVIGSWIEGPDSQEVDGALTTAVIIPAPPPPAPKPAAPKLRITHATASHKHGATITGTATVALTGRVVVYAACGKASVSGAPLVQHGKFSDHVRLPASCRRAKRVRLGVVWAGSAAFARETVSREIRIAK
jgi:hypothetical protein